MGWMFYYDRKHWTPEIISAYLRAVPQGKVTILDYYTENIPVWKQTDSFYGQPWTFCYLGNFGGNTRFAGPFRLESERIGEALQEASPSGIGCTLEGFGLNRWFYEYVLGRAWDGPGDEEWLCGLDRRRHSPEGFWQSMADSIYVRGSFSEGALLCGRPCLKGNHNWRVFYQTRYEPRVLVRRWKELLDHPSESAAWRYDAVAVGSQALANLFADLRDSFAQAYERNDLPAAEALDRQLRDLLSDIAAITACEPTMRLESWLSGAESWACGPQETEYFRHNAWHIITTWGVSQNLNDYASRLWSELVSEYYAPRWKMFLDYALECLKENRPYEQDVLDEKVGGFEQAMVALAPAAADAPAAENPLELASSLYGKWFRH